MRLVTATVIYKEVPDPTFGFACYGIVHLSVVTREGHLITLVQQSEENMNFPITYCGLHDLIKAVLKILKNNDFYTKSYMQFRGTWYDIQYIDYDNPCKVCRYPYQK